MTPAHAMLNPTDDTLGNAIVSRNLFLLSRVIAYCDCLFGSQFSGPALLASIRRAVLYAIHLIGACRVPSQISQAVIKRVAIVMAGLLSSFWRTNKGEKYEPMDADVFLAIVFPKQHEGSIKPSISCGLFYSPRQDCPDATKIGNVIKPLIANNGSPLFHDSSVSMCGISYHV